MHHTSRLSSRLVLVYALTLASAFLGLPAQGESVHWNNGTSGLGILTGASGGGEAAVVKHRAYTHSTLGTLTLVAQHCSWSIDVYGLAPDTEYEFSVGIGGVWDHNTKIGRFTTDADGVGSQQGYCNLVTYTGGSYDIMRVRLVEDGIATGPTILGALTLLDSYVLTTSEFLDPVTHTVDYSKSGIDISGLRLNGLEGLWIHIGHPSNYWNAGFNSTPLSTFDTQLWPGYVNTDLNVSLEDQARSAAATIIRALGLNAKTNTQGRDQFFLPMQYNFWSDKVSGYTERWLSGLYPSQDDFSPMEQEHSATDNHNTSYAMVYKMFN